LSDRHGGWKTLRIGVGRDVIDVSIDAAAMNLGRTRADELLTLKVEERRKTAFSFLL
jgi:hypothetical protein